MSYHPLPTPDGARAVAAATRRRRAGQAETACCRDIGGVPQHGQDLSRCRDKQLPGNGYFLYSLTEKD